MALKLLTNQINPCVMNNITQKTVDYIDSRIYNKNYTIVDFTWFNQYTKQSLSKIQGDFVVCVDVADPPYFHKEKLSWIKNINKPVIYVGPPTNEFNNVIPFLAWLRFRPQTLIKKSSYDNFFLSFNRKPHNHRQFYYDYLSTSNLKNKGLVSHSSFNPIHKIHSLDLDKDIVELQRLAQIIDEKQSYSLFEIVCETSPSNNHIFLTEKFNKCIASETPLFLVGNRNALTILKNYYGFSSFGPDDSYDSLPTFRERVVKMLRVADLFFSYPLNSVFDNAKKNAYHLFTDFDAIHDRIVDKKIEMSMKNVKYSSTNGSTFSDSV